MSDGKFVLNFLGQETKNEADVRFYRPYFVDYTVDKWDAEVSGGAFERTAHVIARDRGTLR
jgi:hypothetical protein